MEKVKLSISDVLEFHGLSKKEGRFNTQERKMCEQILNTDPDSVNKFLSGQMVDIETPLVRKALEGKLIEKDTPIVAKALKGELIEKEIINDWIKGNAEETNPDINGLIELLG